MKNNLTKSVDLVNSIEMLVRERRSFSSHTSLLLSISGGQDSTCLTAIMAQLQRQWGSRLGAVACNHLWQEDSFYSSFHIARICFLLKQSFCFVPTSHQPTLDNEGKARVWRQNIIQRLACFYQYPAICTGHTSSDRVETMLFNLIRGSGKKGLSSLYWSRFLKTSYPELCYLSNFNGTALDQKERFVWPTASILSKEKNIPLYQACVLCKSWRTALPSRIIGSAFCGRPPYSLLTHAVGKRKWLPPLVATARPSRKNAYLTGAATYHLL